MRLKFSRAILLAAFCPTGYLAGCTPHKPAPAPTTMRAQEVDPAALRATLQKRPDIAAIGTVTIILPDAPWIEVSDLNVQEVKLGDIFTIIAGDYTPIANATVAAITKNGAHMNYRLLPGRRDVQVGDVAIKFKSQSL